MCQFGTQIYRNDLVGSRSEILFSNMVFLERRFLYSSGVFIHFSIWPLSKMSWSNGKTVDSIKSVIPHLNTKSWHFFKKRNFIYTLFFRLKIVWNVCSINLLVGFFWREVEVCGSLSRTGLKKPILSPIYAADCITASCKFGIFVWNVNTDLWCHFAALFRSILNMRRNKL